MSHYNANNVGYSPMTNHGEFGSAAPAQTQFMYYSTSPVTDVLRSPPAQANVHAPLQESPMLRQHEQLYSNVQKPEQYSSQPGFQHHGQQQPASAYPAPYAAPRLHPNPYNDLMAQVPNSQANNASAHNSHSVSPQGQWITPDPMPSHLNPNIMSPTGQRYPQSPRFPAPMTSMSQSVNAQQNAMVPSALQGRYQSGAEIQNNNFSASSNVRYSPQVPQGVRHVSPSSSFAQSSHVPFMHMAQSYPPTPTQRSSTPNSIQYNQNQRTVSQNFQQSKTTPSPKNQMRYENVSPSIESHQVNINSSFQIPHTKSHKPDTVQSMSRSQGAGLNQINRDSNSGQKASSSFSHPNSGKLETRREMHNTVQSDSYPASFTSRQDNLRHSSVANALFTSLPSVAPRNEVNFNENPNDNLMYLLQKERVQTTATVRAERSQERNVALGQMYRPETAKAGTQSRQTAAPQARRGGASQGRGRGPVARGAGLGSAGKVATRGVGARISGRGVTERGRGWATRAKSVSTAVRGSMVSDQLHSPIQWYKHPDSLSSSYQSDVEAMRANVHVEQSISQRVAQTSTSFPSTQRSDTLKAPTQRTSHAGSSSSTPTRKSNETNQRSNLPEKSGYSSNSTYNNSPSFSSLHHPSAKLHTSPSPNERIDEGGEKRRSITSMKEIGKRIKGEPMEAASVNSPTQGKVQSRAIHEMTTQLTSPIKPVERTPSTGTTTWSSSNAVTAVSSVNPVSISKTSTSVSLSPDVKKRCQTVHCRSNSTNEKSSTQAVLANVQRRSSLSHHVPTSTQTSTTSSSNSSVNAAPPQEIAPNKRLHQSISEPVSGQSARDKVFSMWKAGQVVGRVPVKGKAQVVGRVPVKGKTKSKGQESANLLRKENSPALRGILEKSCELVNRKSSKARDEAIPTTEPPGMVEERRAPFYALFHGHKIMCISSKQGNLVLICQFLQECFPDKGKGSVGNCINRALRIKKKVLEHPSKDKILKYLTNNGYLSGKGDWEPLHMISLDDARRVYHYMYKISNCSSASCVVQLENQAVDLEAVVTQAKRLKLTNEKIRRIKKEKQTAEDVNYGKISQPSGSIENGKLNAKHFETETNKLCTASSGSSFESAEKRTDTLANAADDDDNDDDDDELNDLIIVEGPGDPYFIRSNANEKHVGRVVNTLIGRVRSYHHNGENYLVVPDLCGVLGYSEFMSGVEKDNVDIYSCSNDILSFLNTMQSGFARLTSGQNSLIKEKDVGSYSYDEDSSEIENNTICPIKEVSCKQEVMDNVPECSAAKQPRLEADAHTANNSSPSITSDVSAFSSTEAGNKRQNVINDADMSGACSNDQVLENSNKKTQGRELPISESPAEESIPNCPSKESTVDEGQTVMVFSTSSINHNKTPTHSVDQTEGESEKIASNMPVVNDNINSVKETTSGKTKSSNDSEDRLHSNFGVIVSEKTQKISGKSAVDVSSKEENECAKVDLINSKPRRILSANGDQRHSKSPTSQIVASTNTACDTDTRLNKNILTVIDNPHAHKSNSRSKEAANSDAHSNQKVTVAVAMVKPTISLESDSRHAFLPRVSDTQHTQPKVTQKATLPVNNISKESDENSLNGASISNVQSEQASLSSIANKSKQPLSDSKKEVNVITPNFLVIEDMAPPSSSNTIAAPSIPALVPSGIGEKTPPRTKHRTFSCDSSASSSSFLQIASSPSFQREPKTAASALKYCPDDLELLCPSTSGGECYKTKQALLQEMIVLRYKNKALQDMVKHLRRELMSSKEKNESNAKMIQYYERVLQEITASFKDGESEVKESSEGHQAFQGGGDSSAPILIDDD